MIFQNSQYPAKIFIKAKGKRRALRFPRKRPVSREALDIIGDYNVIRVSFESGEGANSEAYSDFEAYRNYLEEKYGGYVPTEEDYNAAVQSLFYYYEYYYGRKYKELKE